MTRQKCATAVVLLSIWAAATAAQDTVAPFRVEQTEIDVGTVVAGSTATATFIFHNDGPTDVNIIRAKPS